MNRPTILVVDDEAEIMRSLSFILSEDFHVLTASNGREGLSILDTTQPSLILLDLQMPEMNGIRFLEHLRSSGSNTPVLVMTGNSCHEWAKRCADLNIQGYIEKPIDAEALIKRIKNVLMIEDFELLRMIWGKRYLIDTDKSISEIADLIGTPDASYFGKLFKKYAGTTPKEFRENPASYNPHNNR